MHSQSRTAASTMCSSRSCHKVLYLHANDSQPTLEHTFYHIMLAGSKPKIIDAVVVGGVVVVHVVVVGVVGVHKDSLPSPSCSLAIARACCNVFQ